MREQYDEEELKNIILGGGEAPDFGAEYDSLTVIPTNRCVEEIDEGNVARTLQRAYERVSELRAQGVQVDMSPTYSNNIRLIYRVPQTREEYINYKLSVWRNQSSRNSYKHYLFTTIGLRNESSIRNIYVKLLLEHKISVDDFRDLVCCKDIEVDLVGVCQGHKPVAENYFI